MPKRSPARVFRATPRNLGFLARQLKAGKLVAVPTETVYGLAANALDAKACAAIFRAKGRPQTDPLIVHCSSVAALSPLCHLNKAALQLAEAFWPGPLTLVLPKKAVIPDVVTAGLPSVAVRVPSHPVFRRLLAKAGLPLAAPSANPFGYISPTTAAHVREGLGKKIRYILQGGMSGIGLESTIVDLRDPSRPRLLRPGAISRRDLERVLHQKISSPSPAGGRSDRAQISPGLLLRHYSPRTPITLHNAMREAPTAAEAYLFLGRPSGKPKPNIFWLDANGALKAAARRLFATLRRLDQMGFARIHVELAPAEGIGEAINDRLNRAAAR